MASKYKLQNYISFLTSIGKKVNEIWQSVKKHINFKFTANATIEKTINDVAASKERAKQITSGKMNETVLEILGKEPNTKQQGYKIGYSFRFDFPGYSKTGKEGKQSTYFTIDVPAGTTKKQLRELIRQRIRDWIEENYIDEDNSKNRITFKITDVQ